MKILPVCDVDASSGFMAQSMRKAAKERGVEAEIIARSDVETLNNVQEADILMVGLHLEHNTDNIREKVSPYGIPVTFISREAYGSADRDAILMQVIEYVKQQGGTVPELNTIQEPGRTARTAKTEKSSHTAGVESGKSENALFH